eukprot:2876109-Prymnesium_polylepis.1
MSYMYVNDRVVRSLTQTIVELQRVVQSHTAGRLQPGGPGEASSAVGVARAGLPAQRATSA